MSSTLPAGVVTFLFTDVEGSTKLLHELGDAYADALHEHRRLLREAFTAHEGVEVDTQGDAFFVAFGRPSDGVAAAADAQLALAGGPIRVRMGLHTGEPRVTEEGYVGLDVHKGARIAAVGYGGPSPQANQPAPHHHATAPKPNRQPPRANQRLAQTLSGWARGCSCDEAGSWP